MSYQKRAAGPPSSAPKRPRFGDDDDEEEEDIDAMIDMEEEMMADEAEDGPPPPDEEVAACLTKTQFAAFSKQWTRPAPPPLDPSADEITFQQIEADYTIEKTVPEMAGSLTKEERAAVIRMFGTTKDGNSVMVHVHGFFPYFYVRAPPGFQQSHVESFKQALGSRLKAQSTKEPLVSPVLQADLVRRQSIMHYSFGEMGAFIRVVVATPPMVSTCRRILENGIPVMGGGQHCFETFESNWAYALRFMVDRDIVGCSWATLRAGSWRPRPWTTNGGARHNATLSAHPDCPLHRPRAAAAAAPRTPCAGPPGLPPRPCIGGSALGRGASAALCAGARLDRKSHCQLEVDVTFSNLKAHAPDGEYMAIAPLRILSFDIECAGCGPANAAPALEGCRAASVGR
jgi:DNA polymerase elongation subunit (family B)